MTPSEFEIGQRFGRWVIIGAIERPIVGFQHRAAVPCRCDCGTEKLVLIQTLQRQNRGNLSCGCWKRERTATIAKETRWKNSHGRSKDPLYNLWKRIKRRCHDPNAHNYKWYGGRGISMWEPWRNDAGLFMDWVDQNLGPRPTPKHSINRIDNDGDYEPGNLDWADPVSQAKNRRPRGKL